MYLPTSKNASFLWLCRVPYRFFRNETRPMADVFLHKKETGGKGKT
jgi:hypothetical protein